MVEAVELEVLLALVEVVRVAVQAHLEAQAHQTQAAVEVVAVATQPQAVTEVQVLSLSKYLTT